MVSMRTSIHGRRLGLGPNDELVANEKRVSSPVVGCTIAVAAASTSPRAVTLQVTDANGKAVAEVTKLELFVYTTAGMTAFSTGGTTGLAASVGVLLALVAKKIFDGTTDANGAMTLSWTDTGTDAAILVVKLPNGEYVVAPVVMTIGV